ncbi:MAG: DUF4261 domain-containing protein [Sandaracinaceae bacterium]|mgnify:CR=1 FL=1
MPRGFFTQSTTVLFSQAPSIDAIEEALAPLGASITRRETEPGWLSGGTELLVPFGESPAGTLHVDVVDQAWPDGMGHPEEAADLFGAWTMGAFGPLAFPNNLARAAQQAVAFPGAKEAVAGHGAFVRLRTSYLVGAGPDAPIMPEGWSPLAEIDAMLQIVRPVLGLEGALAYFDPNAEVLLPVPLVREVTAEGEAPPLELFTHVRLFNIDPRWALMDTVGLERCFLPDVEVLVPAGVDPNQVADFLRSITAYLLENGPVIEEGHSTEGPFGVLHVHAREEPLTEPPRQVLRLVLEGAELPDGVL